MALVIVSDPLHKSYKDLFDKVLDLKPSSIDVHIPTKLESYNHFSFVLKTLYDEIRGSVLAHGLRYNFSIDVLFNDICYDNYENIYVSNKEVIDLPKLSVTVIPSEIADISAPKLSSKDGFSVVAVGGTFDHIHDGHKILLSTAVYLSKSKVIVGVTDDELLKKKQYKQYLQLFEQRLKITNQFLQKIGNDYHQFDIYKIVDVCGPTGYIKDIECLVLSKESESGGDYVNNFRESVGYPKLAVYAIELIGGENKLSSTDLRREEQEITMK